MEKYSVECPRCGGTGKCCECDGTGFSACGTCKGKGTLDVKTFSGDNVVRKCHECDGTGTVPCPSACEVCGGKGIIVSDGGGFEPSGESRQNFESFAVIELKPARPMCTYTLIVLCCIATLCSGCLFGKGNILFALGVFYSPLISEGQWWRFITALFLHGGFMHLVLNMWCMFALCPTIEQILGPKRFLSLYFISGIAGFALTMAFMSSSPSVGASGAIFGIMTSYFAIYLKYRLFDKSAMRSLLFWFGINLVSGLMIPNINMCAHLGGAVVGFLYAYIIRLERNSR